MTAHAKLSASGAYRWLTCTMAPTYESQFEDDTSPAAALGTLAHTLGEHCLISGDMADTVPGAYPDDMRRHIQGYVDYVMGLGVTRLIERRVDFSPWVPEGFGTSDAIVFSDRKTLKIADLKYGRGKVDADKPQGKLYALGVLNDYSYLCEEVEDIELHIYQPRLDHIDVHKMTKAELLAWGEEIKPIALKAFNGEGEFVAGDHCVFCRGRHSCKARAEENMRIARIEAGLPPISPFSMTELEVAELLPRLPEFERWCSDVRNYALDLAQDSTLPGYKAVHKKTNRRWRNEEDVEVALRGLGLKDDEIYTRKVIGITAAEKLLKVGHPIFDLTVQPEGEPELVPETDKREAITRQASSVIGGFDTER